MVSSALSENEAYVPVRRFTTFDALPEADGLCSYLRANGIRARLLDENTVSTLPHYGICLEGVKVVVPTGQFDQARTLMEAPPEYGGEALIDDSNVSNAEDSADPITYCPHCGANALTNTPLSTGMIILLIVAFIALFPISAFLILPIFYYRLSLWSCSACGWHGSSKDLT